MSILDSAKRNIDTMSIDKAHLDILAEVLNTGFFKDALEIGSYKGVSSAAFLAALSTGRLEHASFCDTAFQREFFDQLLSAGVPKERVSVYPENSIKIINGSYFDFVFVDGDHSLAQVSAEIYWISQSNSIHTIMAHDTNSSNIGYANCEGARYLSSFFSNCAAYKCVEDRRHRDGQNTDRGLFLATLREDVFDVCKGIFDKSA